MFRWNFIQVFNIFLQFCLINTCKGFYTIYAPGTLRSNRKYTICVTLHNSTEPALLNVGISSESSWSNTQLVSLQPFQTKMLDFFPPKLDEKKMYELMAKSINGMPFEESYFLHARADDGPRIYIETDKGNYKPGDLIRFRVVVLDENAKPMNIIEPIKVQILDSTRHRVKQFKDIPLTKGVYVGEFQLTKEPSLGVWQIKVFIGGKYNKESMADFNVKNYVLPKFKAHIETEPDFAIANRYININVYGKYTYNRYVEGKVHLEIEQSGEIFYNQTVNIEDYVAKFKIDYDKLQILHNLRDNFVIVVWATVEEKQTGINQRTSVVINLHKESYEITIPDNEIEFRNDIPYRIKAKIQHWNKTLINDQLTSVFMDHNDKTYESKMDANGLATFEFDYNEYADYTFRYKDSTAKQPPFQSYTFLMQASKEINCQVSLRDKRPKLNSNIGVIVDFKEDVSYFIYTLTAHGNIIQNEMIRFETNQNSSVIQIKATIEMMPISFVYVHYIVGNDLKYCELEIELAKEELENKISISVPKTAEPGKDITMNIKTQPNSHVSITAVDVSTRMLDTEYKNKINQNIILWHMRYDVSYVLLKRLRYPGFLSGLITLFNANYLNDNPMMKPTLTDRHNGLAGGLNYGLKTTFASAQEENSISHWSFEHTDFSLTSTRTEFPETWLFKDFETKNEVTTLTVKVPDSITTWLITAFTVNEETGFGSLQPTVEMTVFKQFFISTNLPYSIKRGEIVLIPAVIFNYYPINLHTEIVMDNNLKEFKFIDNNSNKTLNSLLEKQQILVPTNSGKEVMFRIKPLKAGTVNINLMAKNNLFSDGILQKLQVDLDGKGEYQNHDLYVSLKDAENFTTYYMTKIPQNVVPDSEFLQLSISGNILLPTLENLQDLVNKPKGCGEQNMINFVPNILALDYLRATRQTTKYSKLVAKAKRYIEIGYQQQLKFWHKNGGYSVFGPDISMLPSNWLTAYVTRFFIRALKYLPIESKLIESSLDFLSTQQLESGEFMQAGYLFHPAYQNSYAFTAYVLLSFQESKQYANKYANIIDKGLNFLLDNLENIDDIYSLAIIANVFQAAKHEKATWVLDKLKPLAQIENGLKWWSGSNSDRISEIEITSYILMALLHTPDEYLPIVKWLLEQRNSRGGFKSTQDTVVGLQALVKFAQISAPQNNTLIKVEYKAYNKRNNIIKTGYLGLSSDNLMILQQQELPRATRSLDLQITGTGNVFLQFSYQYHIGAYSSSDTNLNTRASIEKSFAITTKVESQFEGLIMELDICILYTPLDDVKYINTNMIITEIELPSGYIPNTDNIYELQQSDIVDRVITDTPNKIVLYFAYLTPRKQKCIHITADKKVVVQNLQPSTITVYDYYHANRLETVTYEMKL